MEEQKKIKLLALGDNIMFSSGVGLQARYLLQGLQKTGKYEILQLAGAKHHPSYEPFIWQDILLKPVNGYGDKMTLRIAMDEWQPDAVWFITDPRFYAWLFEMSDEILSRCPLLYWHVWDEKPAPKFNKPFYDSCSHIGAISKLTYDILKELKCDNVSYIPHALPRDVFKPNKENKIALRKKLFPNVNPNKFFMLWIGVNAPRKRIGEMLQAYNEVLQEHPDCALIMKTKIAVDESINPITLIEDQFSDNIKVNENIFFIEDIISPNDQGGMVKRDLTDQEMADLYTVADILVNNSSHEGFGLSVLQALYTATPPLVNKTGGMTGQLVDDEGNEFGFPVEPSTYMLMGNSITPYIRESMMGYKNLANKLSYIIKNHKDNANFLQDIGNKCYERSKYFDIDNMISAWDQVIVESIDKHKASYQPYSIVKF